MTAVLRPALNSPPALLFANMLSLSGVAHYHLPVLLLEANFAKLYQSMTHTERWRGQQ